MAYEPMPAIELCGISKRFAKVPAADRIDLAVAPGDRVALVGRSGAGKTTLLRIMAGLEVPDCGQVLIDGVEVARLAPVDRSVALVSQDYALYPQLNVEQNLQAALVSAKLDSGTCRQRIAEVLQWFAIEDLRTRTPAQLSGGQAQRVAFAKALVRRPAILLLDEPLSQFDVLLRREAADLLLASSERVAMAVVMVTHDPLDAMQLSTKIVVLESGCIQQSGSPEEVYRKPRSKLVADLLSPFGMNWIGVAELRHLDIEFPYDADASQQWLGFRPESVRIQVAASERLLPQLTFMATIDQIRGLGFADIGLAHVGNTQLRMLGAPGQFGLGEHKFGVNAEDLVWL